MPIVHMRRDPARAKAFLEENTYDKIYVARRFDRDSEGNLKTMSDLDSLDTEQFKLNRVETKKFGRNLELHIDELIDVQLSEAAEPEEPAADPGTAHVE